MGVKKGLAVILVFGLLLMGVTPTLAAGAQVKAAATAQQEEIVQVVVPEGPEIGDKSLEGIQRQWYWAVAGAIVGAYTAYKQWEM